MIKTERLTLRAVEERDIQARVSWFNDPKVLYTLNFEQPIGEASTKQWLDRALRDSRRRDFTVCRSEDDSTIGYGGLLNIDARAAKAEIYGGIGRTDLWGQGLGREMQAALVGWGFRELRLHRIWATVWVENPAMCAIYERLGFKKEGTIRDDVFSHGEWRDRAVYGLLRDEFLHQAK